MRGERQQGSANIMERSRVPVPGLVSVLLVLCFNRGASGALVQNSTLLNAVFRDTVKEASLQDVIGVSPESGLNSSCFDPANNYANLRTCVASKCVSTEDLARLYVTKTDTRLEPGQLMTLAPGILHVLTQTHGCSSVVEDDVGHGTPGPTEIWGYGFLFVTLINLCSLFGVLVVPCMKMKIYKMVLMFLVALAVGTLAGSGLLVLIPEALDLGHGDNLNFLWKTSTVMGGIYLFFCLERIMRIVNAKRENTKEKKKQDEDATQGTYVSTFTRIGPDSPMGIVKNVDNLIHHHRGGGVADESSQGQPPPAPREAEKNGHSHSHGAGHSLTEVGSGVAPVAYMIIFGDALHNLIDGLSIGAAFTESTLLGISVSVAVMCEELPHELGDFAILLNSGMTVRKALMANFLSSLSCYMGLVIGIVLGENTSANTWIFAIAGGMFLYISLADMLPEMNSSAESEDGVEFGLINTFILQNFGLLIGFGIILILAVFGGDINF